MSEIASAYVSLLPSFRGFGAAARTGITAESTAVGKSGGLSLGKALVGGVTLGIAGLTAAGGVLYQIGGVFDDISDSIRISTGKTGADLDSLSQSAENVGKRAPVALESIAPIIGKISDRLGLTGKPLENLTTQFADLGHLLGQDVDVDTVTKSFAAFNIKGAGTSQALDQIFRVTQSTGIQFDSLTSSLTRNGPVLAQFGFNLQESASLIGSLDQAGLDSNKTLASLSKAMSTFAKAGQDPKKALLDTIGQIQGFIKTGDQAAAVNVASKVFGTRGATQFVAAVKAGKLNLDSLTDATKGNSDTIIKATHDTSDFAESFQLFKNKALIAVKPLADQVFGALGRGGGILNRTVAPAINRFTNQMKAGTGQGGAFVSNLRSLGNTLLGVGRGLLQVGGFLNQHRAVLVALIAVYGAYRVTVAAVAVATKVQATYTAVSTAVTRGYAAAVALSKGQLATRIGVMAIDTAAWIRNTVATVASTVASKAAALATRAFTIGQAALNLVLAANPIGLVVVAIAGLVAGFVLAYRKSDTFRAIVDATFKGIRKVVSSVIGFVVPFIKKHWGLLVSIIGGPLAIVAVQVVKHFGTIKSIASSVASFVVGTAKKYGEFASAVVNKVGDVVSFFKKLPGKIKGFLAALPGQLKTIGGQIVDGLKRGIEAAASKVESAVRAIVDKIPKFIRKHLGIASPSKVTTYMGKMVSQGLAVGMTSKSSAVTSAATALANTVSDKVGDGLDKAKKNAKKKTEQLVKSITDKLSGLKDDLAGLVDPIASNFTQGLFDFTDAGSFGANLTTVKGTLQGLLGNFQKLIGEGLSPGFLYQLFQNGGAPLINSLAGLDKASAQSIATQFAQVTDLSTTLGNRVAVATDKGADIQKQTDVLSKKLDKLTKAVQHSGDQAERSGTRAAANAHRRRRRTGVKV